MKNVYFQKIYTNTEKKRFPIVVGAGMHASAIAAQLSKFTHVKTVKDMEELIESESEGLDIRDVAVSEVNKTAKEINQLGNEIAALNRDTEQYLKLIKDVNSIGIQRTHTYQTLHPKRVKGKWKMFGESRVYGKRERAFEKSLRKPKSAV